MCGITGIFNLNRNRVDESILSSMSAAQKHRGPDDAGSVLLNDNILGFAHNRLSIIDLSPFGHQPMSNKEKTVWLVFNGMIYNYLELKEELEQRGHIFYSKSDTEVIIHAYSEYGEDCFSRFNGMWALALWDDNKKMLLCCRDRLGIKPLHFFHSNDYFIFSSEIKALLKHPVVPRQPNYNTIYSYLNPDMRGHNEVNNNTFFKGIKKIQPGSYLKLSNSTIEEKKYWVMTYGGDKHNLSEDEATRQFSNIFRDAVRIRLRSDVPIGISLSGGLDSSSVAAVAKDISEISNVQAFTLSFQEKNFDESSYAMEVAQHINIPVHILKPKSKHVFKDLTELVWHHEEPFQNLNVYSNWLIMSEARKRGILVLLNGHGGDEALNGYARDFHFYFADLMRNFDWMTLRRELNHFAGIYEEKKSYILKQVIKLLISTSVPHEVKNKLKLKHFLHSNNLLRSFIDRYRDFYFSENKFNSFMERSTYTGYKIYPLPNWLHTEDRVSMAHAIEARSPFLDHRLFEFTHSLPSLYKFREGLNKYILRQAMKGYLPESVRMRSRKMGFPTPTEHWLKVELHDEVISLFKSKQFSDRGIFNVNEVLKTFKEHCGGKINHRFILWSWINLELWFRQFFD